MDVELMYEELDPEKPRTETETVEESMVAGREIRAMIEEHISAGRWLTTESQHASELDGPTGIICCLSASAEGALYRAGGSQKGEHEKRRRGGSVSQAVRAGEVINIGGPRGAIRWSHRSVAGRSPAGHRPVKSFSLFESPPPADLGISLRRVTSDTTPLGSFGHAFVSIAGNVDASTISLPTPACRLISLIVHISHASLLLTHPRNETHFASLTVHCLGNSAPVCACLTTTFSHSLLS
ncbi:hypothetical protein BV25DRAFT_1498563 [Artomyces pyxidatus]|uniref:Uncharacterized protein n=1 Tax=Artomyces pyxidatus TaxID=48021 RepID=A0ACB8TBA4_9AGAM|nr:hypothetical protein BV25DRAFT_1498563 [Artomyces pyxidatus]